MSQNADARQSALDRVLDEAEPGAGVGEELFAAADALGGSASLRRALTDMGTPEDARSGIVRTLFGSRVSPVALSVLEKAAALPWSSSSALVAAIERQGVRAILGDAQRDGSLDTLEEQLFRVERTVDANPDLRAALADRRVDMAHREHLVDEVFGAHVRPDVLRLARRAVRARQRTFALTVDGYLKTVADLRNRRIATVEVARPLTEEQTVRLRTALSRQIGRVVTLNVIVNPAVVGGVRVSLGDDVIEGTVAGRLADVRRQLS